MSFTYCIIYIHLLFCLHLLTKYLQTLTEWGNHINPLPYTGYLLQTTLKISEQKYGKSLYLKDYFFNSFVNIVAKWEIVCWRGVRGKSNYLKELKIMCHKAYVWGKRLDGMDARQYKRMGNLTQFKQNLPWKWLIIKFISVILIDWTWPLSSIKKA